MLKYKGMRALDELVGPNKGKIRLLSRADEKIYKKGKSAAYQYSEQNESSSHMR
jgi:hypothetical protein